MNKKAYMTPAIAIEKVKLTPLMTGSITSIGGDSGIELGTGDVPTEGDSRLFDEDDDYDF